MPKPQNENFKEMMDAAKAAFQRISEKDDSSQNWWNRSLRSYFASYGKIDKVFRKSFDNELNALVLTAVQCLEKAKAEQAIQSVNDKISELIGSLNSLTEKSDAYYFDHKPYFTKDITTIWNLFTDLQKLPQNAVLNHPRIEAAPKENKDSGLSDYKYDAFISYASEDKDQVKTLVDAFKNHNIRCWYDEDSMGWGDALAEKIAFGLGAARYVVLVISPIYFEKYWTRAEYGGAVTRESQEGKVIILPIWHGMDAKEVIKTDPILANKIAVDFSIGVDKIAEKLRSMLDKP